MDLRAKQLAIHPDRSTVLKKKKKKKIVCIRIYKRTVLNMEFLRGKPLAAQSAPETPRRSTSSLLSAIAFFAVSALAIFVAMKQQKYVTHQKSETKPSEQQHGYGHFGAM